MFLSDFPQNHLGSVTVVYVLVLDIKFECKSCARQVQTELRENT